MRLPFGLDVKTIVVVLVVIFFVLPFAQRMLASRQTAKAK